MSDQTGPEAWQKLWSMWIPSTTAFPFGGASGADAGAEAPHMPFPFGAMGMPPMPPFAQNADSAQHAAYTAPFGGMSPSLSMMSEMIAPLTQVGELDKRIAELRAVEHWLKLNLQMLQSTTQALEVQRATLATLRAFGVAAGVPGFGTGVPPSASSPASSTAAASAAHAAPAHDATQPEGEQPANAPGDSVAQAAAAMAASLEAMPALDPNRWWTMLNDQFHQMAAAAAAATDMPGAPPSSASSASPRGASRAAAPAGPEKAAPAYTAAASKTVPKASTAGSASSGARPRASTAARTPRNRAGTVSRKKTP